MLSGFELYPRWVPLTAGKSFEKNYILHGKRSNSLLKSLALQQRVSLFNSLKSSL